MGVVEVAVTNEQILEWLIMFGDTSVAVDAGDLFQSTGWPPAYRQKCARDGYLHRYEPPIGGIPITYRLTEKAIKQLKEYQNGNN